MKVLFIKRLKSLYPFYVEGYWRNTWGTPLCWNLSLVLTGFDANARQQKAPSYADTNEHCLETSQKEFDCIKT